MMKYLLFILLFSSLSVSTVQAQLIPIPNVLDSTLQKWLWSDTTVFHYRIKFGNNYNIAFIVKLHVKNIQGDVFLVKKAEQIENGVKLMSSLNNLSFPTFRLSGYNKRRKISIINIPVFTNTVDESIQKSNLMRRSPVFSEGQIISAPKGWDLPDYHIWNFMYFFGEFFVQPVSKGEVTTSPVWITSSIHS